MVKIGLQGIDVDEEYLEGLFLRLNDQIGRMVKKDCYTIQEAYILIHSWYEVLAEVFGKLTDKYSGQEIISLPYSDREELGKLGRQAIFQPRFQEISYALDQVIDSHSQKASNEAIVEQLQTFREFFGNFKNDAYLQKVTWVRKIAETNKLGVEAREIYNWLTHLNKKRGELKDAEIKLLKSINCDENTFLSMVKDLNKRIQKKNGKSYIRRLTGWLKRFG